MRRTEIEVPLRVSHRRVLEGVGPLGDQRGGVPNLNRQPVSLAEGHTRISTGGSSN